MQCTLHADRKAFASPNQAGCITPALHQTVDENGRIVILTQVRSVWPASCPSPGTLPAALEHGMQNLVAALASLVLHACLSTPPRPALQVLIIPSSNVVNSASPAANRFKSDLFPLRVEDGPYGGPITPPGVSNRCQTLHSNADAIRVWLHTSDGMLCSSNALAGG